MTQESQTQKILKHLLSGKALTSLEAITKFGCLRLSGRILELRERYKIKTEMIVTKSKKRVACKSRFVENTQLSLV